MAYGSNSRGNASVIWICLHTAEGARSARALANFFNGNNNASSHAGCDASELLYMVPRSRAAWTLGPGNPYSVNLEMCAFARWTRAQWLSTGTVDGCPNPRGIIRQAAIWAKRECDHFGISYSRIGPGAVSGWRESVIHHDDYTKGSRWGSHWDCGTGFPWDVFFADVTGGKAPADASDPADMAFPLPAGHYYGPIDGPERSHGGFYPRERPVVRMIQREMQRLGYAPAYAGWADGKWEQPTTDAVRKWERAADRKVDGIIGSGDWEALFGGDMAISDDDLDKIARAVRAVQIPVSGWAVDAGFWAEDTSFWASTYWRNAMQYGKLTNVRLQALEGQVAGLSDALSKLANGQITPDQIRQTLHDAVAENVRITGDVDITSVDDSE